MLSAVAARKAAQAAHQDRSKSVQTPPIAPSPSPPSSPAGELSPPKTISKRKSSTGGGTPKKGKKKLKVKHVDERRPRYFAEEEQEKILFELEGDAMMVDGLDSDIQDEDFDLAVPLEASTSQAFIPSGKKRAWSPSVPLQDSSDDEESEKSVTLDAQTAAQPHAKTKDPIILSSFRPIPEQNIFILAEGEIHDLHLDGSTTVIILRLGETLALLGTYTFTVVNGSISLCGVTIAASQIAYDVFAPRSSPIPVLQSVVSEPSNSQSSQPSLPARIRNSCKTDDAVLIIQELRTGVEGLGRVCKTFDGVFLPSRGLDDDTPDQQLNLTGVYLLTRQTRHVHAFQMPITWETALSSIHLPNDDETMRVIPLVCLIKGPKKSGKSTFSRTVLNHLLTRYRKVAFLECDLGQSEFTPGGMVALNVIGKPVFGPPFTHPVLPEIAHFIGSTSPRSSPSEYLSAIQALIHSYRLDVQTNVVDERDQDDTRISGFIPLVVNTMGWSKGLGADLTHKIEDMVEPTDIFEIEAPVPETGWSVQPPSTTYDLARTCDTRIHILEPIPTSMVSNSYSPADHRTLSILSYLHAVFPPAVEGELQQISTTSWKTALPLCAQPPYEVDWKVAFDKVLLTGAGSEDVVSSEIERVLNGAVVGLVSCEAGTIDIDTTMPTPSSNSSIPYSQGTSIPMPSSSTCYGLALIRSISSTHMHILTPIPPRQLSKCRLIVKGEMELPIWGMLDYRGDNGDVAGVERGKVPYLQWGKGEGLGGERRRVRRNLMRKGQM